MLIFPMFGTKLQTRQQRDKLSRMGSKPALAVFLFFATSADAFVGRNLGFLPYRSTNGISSSVESRANTLDLTEGVHTLTSKDQGEFDLDTLDTMEIKRRLLDLLPRMTGKAEEFKAVETYVNSLEDRYTPVQTLDFLNLCVSGEWQILFSTNLAAGPRPNFRIREMFQRVEANSLEGTLDNEVTWDLAEDGSTFDASGTFTIKCSYKINQGARMEMDLEDHVLKLATGSIVPKDVQSLVGLLHQSMPKELFDPNDHGIDTTYLDGDLRIVRMTGPRFEGVRDIFIRRDRKSVV